MSHEGNLLLKPTVLWAQRKEMVLLRILIQPSEKPDFKIHDSHMTFKGLGVGASGKNWYGFELSFYEAVSTEKCRIKISEKEIEFRLLKKNPGEWVRLQSTNVKPHWIQLDFDHFDVSEDEEEEDDAKAQLKKKYEEQMKSLEEEMKKQTDFYNNIIDIADKVKMCYLVLYNVGQWIGFLIIFLRLLFLLTYGLEGITKAYHDVAPLLKICQGLATLEIVHSMLGFVKGGVAATFAQVSGRSFILFLTISPAESIQSSPVVYVLFLVWSMVELVRYPYYALSLLNKEVWWLTWLRYTVWIPLYPSGITCEFLALWLSVQYGPPSGGWSYSLPNALNISFSLNAFKVIAMLLEPFMLYILSSYMWSQRKKKLSEKVKKR